MVKQAGPGLLRVFDFSSGPSVPLLPLQMITSTTVQTFRVADAYVTLGRYSPSIQIKERNTGHQLVVENLQACDLREAVQSYISGIRYEDRSEDLASWLDGVIASATRALETHRPAVAEATATEAG